jgi:hypothetical protein
LLFTTTGGGVPAVDISLGGAGHFMAEEATDEIATTITDL